MKHLKDNFPDLDVRHSNTNEDMYYQIDFILSKDNKDVLAVGVKSYSYLQSIRKNLPGTRQSNYKRQRVNGEYTEDKGTMVETLYIRNNYKPHNMSQIRQAVSRAERQMSRSLESLMADAINRAMDSDNKTDRSLDLDR